MPGVMMPQQRPDQVKQIIPMAASIVGNVYGGPAGGAAAGKLAGSITKDEPQAGAVESAANSPESDAMSRRLATYDDHPAVQIANAQSALDQLPEEYKQQYGPVLAQARQAAYQGG